MGSEQHFAWASVATVDVIWNLADVGSGDWGSRKVLLTSHDRREGRKKKTEVSWYSTRKGKTTCLCKNMAKICYEILVKLVIWDWRNRKRILNLIIIYARQYKKCLFFFRHSENITHTIGKILKTKQKIKDLDERSNKYGCWNSSAIIKSANWLWCTRCWTTLLSLLRVKE